MATFTVLNTNDFGAGSLRDSLAQAQANGAGEDTIVFGNAMSGQTIRLTSGELIISAGAVIIDGDINNDGIADVTISGDKTGDGLTFDDAALLTVSSGSFATFEMVRFEGGRARGQSSLENALPGSDAAVITNSGYLQLLGCYVSDNWSAGGRGYSAIASFEPGTAGGRGAIIGNSGILTVSDTLFDGNQVAGGSGGEGGRSDTNGFDGGDGGQAGIVVNTGSAFFENVGFLNTTGAIQGGDGGNGGRGDLNGGDGGNGGHESNIINFGMIQGEMLQIGSAASQANSGGFGGMGAPGSGGADGLAGLFYVNFTDLGGGSSSGFGASGGARMLSTLPNQTLNGSAFADSILGFGGADIINGNDGRDDLAGGHGNDTISGGNHDDIVEGGFGNDMMTGGAHGAEGDTLGFEGLFRISGESGVNIDLSRTTAQNTGVGIDTIGGFENVEGSNYGDTILESAARNTIRGGGGNDLIRHNSGFADMAGEIFDGGNQVDVLSFGGTGSLVHDLTNDTLLSIEELRLESPVGNQTRKVKLDADVIDNGLSIGADISFYSLTGFAQIEFVMGTDTVLGLSFLQVLGTGASRLSMLVTGDNNDEFITGSSIQDTLLGSGGVDELYGNQGRDTLDGGTGNDTLFGGEDDDEITGGAGGDAIFGGDGSRDNANYEASNAGITVNLFAGTASGGHASGDTLTDIEDLTGSGFNDVLTGNNAANILDGGAGDDRIAGGGGADEIIGGAGLHDIAYYSASDSGVTVSLSTGGTVTGGHAIGDTLNGIEDLTGSVHADNLSGNSFGNTLRGGGLHDNLNAAGNDDFLYGDAGDDLLIGGTGADRVDGGAGTDTASWSTADARIIANLLANTATGSGQGVGDALVSIENLTGSAFNDILTGNNASNVLTGSSGNDTIFGNGGVDALGGGSGLDILNGGSGNDLMNGGADADIFVYDTTSFNHDGIIGWQNGTDRIDLAAPELDFPDFTKTQDGADTLLTLNGGNSIRLVGINANTIDVTDFV